MTNIVLATLPNRNSEASSNRVLRGGSWGNDASGARAGGRGFDEPDIRYYGFGFRPVILASAVFDGISSATVPAAPIQPAIPVQPAPPDRRSSAQSGRVERGGSFLDDAFNSRAVNQYSDNSSYRHGSIGFRPVFIADEFIGVAVLMATAQPTTAPAAPVAPVAPAAPAAQVQPPTGIQNLPPTTNIVTASNYKKLYLTKPGAAFQIDPAIRTAILNSQQFSAAGTSFRPRGDAKFYFGSMFAPLHDQDNYFYLTDLVGRELTDNSSYGPTIFGWQGKNIPILKTGYLDDYDKQYQGEDYIRAHSPGTASFIPGLGPNVYSIGAILAAFMNASGIHSKKQSRSQEAEDFWKRAVSTGLAKEQGNYEFIATTTVLKSPLYVRYPGMQTVLDLPKKNKKYFVTSYPMHDDPPVFGFDESNAVGIAQVFKATPAVRKLRAEMLARAAFAINEDSVERVYALLQDIGIQSELDLFRSRPEIKGGTWLAGLRRYRLPPLSGESQTLLNGISNPY